MHKGVFGPLAFRKDFNLNVDRNYNGWYNYYDVVFGGNFPGEAAPINGIPFRVGPSQNFDSHTLLWTMAFKQVALFFYMVELTAHINPDGETFTKEGTLIVSGHGTILAWHYVDFAGGFHAPDFSRPVLYDFVSPDWFDVNPPQVLSSAPVRWNTVPKPPG